MEDRFIDAISRVKGAYSILLLTDDALIAARDPHGFRPLSIGRKGGAYVISSETCALDLIGAVHERDVEPGEVVVIRRGRLRSIRLLAREATEHFCIFEHIYFARPDFESRRPQRLRLSQGARTRAGPRASGVRPTW